MFKALLFDLDGTLIDSMPHHQDAWSEWYARRGIEMGDETSFEATAGRSNAEILLDLFPEHTVEEHITMADEKEAIYRELAAASLGLIGGAEAFCAQARVAGFRMAVCTASTPLNMQLAFQRHRIDSWVETIASPADGLRGKPHPDIFLEAAKRLGIAPADCVVFEDAPLGIEGARRAGMKAVALTTTLPASAFAPFDNVIAIAPDFTTLALPDLISAHKKATHDA